MFDAIRRNLAFLTLLAALVGALSSALFKDRVNHSKESMTAEELLRAVETGAKMPVIAASQGLTRISRAESFDVPILLEAREHAQVFIPDKYAMAALTCGTQEPEFSR